MERGRKSLSLKNPLKALDAVKRKVPIPAETVVKTEIINEDSSEQCYEVTEGEQDYNTMYISDPLQLVSQENIQTGEIHYQYEHPDQHDNSDGQEGVATSWNENSSLADVVKSILGPNQEGPVILHVNNYDGVAVVQVADPQNYCASEGLDSEVSPENPASEEAQVPKTGPEPAKFIVRKPSSPKKPVRVTPMAVNSKSSPANHENLLKSAQLKSSTVENSSLQLKHHENLSEDDVNCTMEYDDGSEVAEHQSVIEDERTMYRVKTKKIRLQIDNLKNSIEKQDLEKRKLELEIRLLKMQVEEKESVAKQKQAVFRRK